MFDLARLERSGLVRHVDCHEALGSTSDRALEIAARDDAALPLLVLAERQTGGRGRGSNRWWAARGALTFSLVLEAAQDVLPPERWPLVSLLTGLAMCEALEELTAARPLQVKWPNDLYLEGRKLGGILCESVPGWRDRLVVGVGVNVNNSLADAPPAITHSARSLIDADGLPRDLTSVLLAMLDRLDLRWTTFLREGFAAMLEDYRRRCLLTGKTVTVVAGGQPLFGICQGIDGAGALRIQTESGLRNVVAGTIDSWE